MQNQISLFLPIRKISFILEFELRVEENKRSIPYWLLKDGISYIYEHY